MCINCVARQPVSQSASQPAPTRLIKRWMEKNERKTIRYTALRQQQIYCIHQSVVI